MKFTDASNDAWEFPRRNLAEAALSLGNFILEGRGTGRGHIIEKGKGLIVFFDMTDHRLYVEDPKCSD